MPIKLDKITSLTLISNHATIISCLGRICAEYNEFKKEANEHLISLKKNHGNNNKKNVLVYPKKYSDLIQQNRIIIAIMACATLEAIVNFYLSFKCDEDEFDILQKCSLYKKVVVLPKLFYEKYSIEPEMSKKLQQLINFRNRVVHSRPEVYIENKKIHKGNIPLKEDKKFIDDNLSKLVLQITNNLIKLEPKDKFIFQQLSEVEYYLGIGNNKKYNGIIRKGDI